MGQCRREAKHSSRRGKVFQRSSVTTNGGEGAVQRSLWSTRISEACLSSISSRQALHFSSPVARSHTPLSPQTLRLSKHQDDIFQYSILGSPVGDCIIKAVFDHSVHGDDTSLFTFVCRTLPLLPNDAPSRASTYTSVVSSISILHHHSLQTGSSTSVPSTRSLRPLRRSTVGTSHSSTVSLKYYSQRTTAESNRSRCNPRRISASSSSNRTNHASLPSFRTAPTSDTFTFNRLIATEIRSSTQSPTQSSRPRSPVQTPSDLSRSTSNATMDAPLPTNSNSSLSSPPSNLST